MAQKKEQDTSMQSALKARARAKRKKPAFVRPESWRYRKFSLSWRRQRGLDNKVRRKIKGWPPSPSTGYKGPNLVRGLHPSGYEEVLVHTVAQLAAINPDTQVARIGRTVGKKKRVEIIAEARKLNLKIVNVKEIKAPATEEEKSEAKEAEEKSGKKEKTKKEKKSKKTEEKPEEEGAEEQ